MGSEMEFDLLSSVSILNEMSYRALSCADSYSESQTPAGPTISVSEYSAA